MAIVRFTMGDEETARARCEEFGGVNFRKCDRHERVWLYDTHVGLCLYETERNGRDDSDFLMVVWNDEKGEPETLTFASTRGWTEPAMSSFVDATPEVQSKYEAWARAKRLRLEASARDARARARARLLEETGLTAQEVDRLSGTVGSQVFEKAYLPLLKSEYAGRLRSEFRKSLATQIRTWLSGASDHRTPLSPRQEACL